MSTPDAVRPVHALVVCARGGRQERGRKVHELLLGGAGFWQGGRTFPDPSTSPCPPHSPVDGFQAGSRLQQGADKVQPTHRMHSIEAVARAEIY